MAYCLGGLSGGWMVGVLGGWVDDESFERLMGAYFLRGISFGKCLKGVNDNEEVGAW